MRVFGFYLDYNVFFFVIKFCILFKSLKFGEFVYSCVIWFGVEVDVFIGNVFMNMYFKLESLCENSGEIGYFFYMFDEMF